MSSFKVFDVIIEVVGRHLVEIFVIHGGFIFGPDEQIES